MENRQIVSYGSDMLSTSNHSLRNIEVRTPSPLSSPADRSVNEEKEKSVRSESSSGGSSPSDLRKRLQRLPSPNEAARLANRVINISHHLSRKRDLYFHGTTNRIEENDEKEEQEGRTHPGRKSFSEFKADARTRRRAKIHSEFATNQTMVVSQSSETNCPQFKNNSKDDKESSRSSSVEAEQDLESLQLLAVSKSKNYSNQYLPLSDRTPSIFCSYRNQHGEDNKEFSKPQKDTFSRSSLNLSSKSSPKGRIELQSLSPISLSNIRPTKFGGYRPRSGVILQNLSSGSEPESSHEILPDRSMSSRLIDNLSTVTTLNHFSARANTPSAFSYKSNSQNFDDYSSPTSLSSKRSLTSKESSNHAFIDNSANVKLENVISSSTKISTIPITENNNQNSNDRLTSAHSLFSRKISREASFYQLPDTSKSDGSRTMSGNVEEMDKKAVFLSARNDVGNCDRQSIEKSSTSLVETVNVSQPENVQYRVTSFEKNYFHEETQRSLQKDFNDEQQDSNYKIPFLSDFPTNSSRSESYAKDHSASSTTVGLLSGNKDSGLSKNDSEKSIPEHFQAVSTTNVLNQVRSKYFLRNAKKKDIKFPLSARTIREEPGKSNFSLQYKACLSEGNSATSSSKELFTDKLKENVYSEESVKDNRDSPALLTNQMNSNTSSKKEITNVPTLVLNSQEMSYSASPGSKTCLEKSLDTNALIMALSNVSLREESPKILTNTYRVSCDDDNQTVPETTRSSEKDFITSKSLSRTISLTSDGSNNRNDQSRPPYKSSPSTSSKIPVKIPNNNNRIELNINELGGSEEELSNLEKTSVDSSMQNSCNIPPLWRELQLDTERNSGALQSGENLSCLKTDTNTNVTESANSMASSSLDTNSKQRSEQSNAQYSQNISQNCSKSENTGRSRTLLSNTGSINCLNSLRSERTDIDQYHCKKEMQTETCRSNFNKNFNSCDSSDNQPTMGDSLSNYSEIDIHKASGRSADAPSTIESINRSFTTVHCYENNESLRAKEVVNSEHLSTKNKSTTSMCNEICKDTLKGSKANLLGNETGDGSCENIFATEADKLKFEEISSNSSPDSEKFERKKTAVTHEIARFSLERLAAEQFRKTICTDQTKNIQSETGTFLSEKFHDIPSYSSSMSKFYYLYDKPRDCSPRFRKKSQDRFPFTISEKTSTTSMKLKIPGRLGSLDEDPMLLENTYKLDKHPSITRLAGSGFDDTTTDIISYATYNEQIDRRAHTSGMKGFVQKFSAKLKKSKKRDATKSDTETASVIYENFAYRGDSLADSCSESSLMKEFRIDRNLQEKQRATDSSSSELSSQIFRQKTSNRENIKGTENPCRRYDRDDLWVEDLKNYNSNCEEEKKVPETTRNVDPYSVFFVRKQSQTPDKVFEEKNVSTKTKKNRVKFGNSSVIVMSKQSEEDMNRKFVKSRSTRNLPKRKRNRKSGCLCLRFYRMIVRVSFDSVPKSRSRISHSNPLSPIKKKSRFSLQKRKK